MNRYWVFCGGDYYAFGGMSDLAGRYDTLEEACDKVRQISRETADGAQWYHIVDVVEERIVRWYGGAYGTASQVETDMPTPDGDSGNERLNPEAD